MSWEGLEEVSSHARRAGRGCEALSESWEGSRGPGKVESFFWRAEKSQETLQKGVGGVWSPCRRAGMGLETLEEGREGSGVSSGDHGGVRRAGRGWESLPEGREGSGGPSGDLEGVGRTSQKVERVWEAFSEGWERLEALQKGEGGVESSSWKARDMSGGLKEGREELGGPSREPGGDSRAGRGREALLQSREG